MTDEELKLELLRLVMSRAPENPDIEQITKRASALFSFVRARPVGRPRKHADTSKGPAASV